MYVCAMCRLLKLGSDPPTETGRWGAMFLNDDILKQWLLGP